MCNLMNSETLPAQFWVFIQILPNVLMIPWNRRNIFFFIGRFHNKGVEDISLFLITPKIESYFIKGNQTQSTDRRVSRSEFR